MQENVALFIDAANLSWAINSLKLSIDFNKLIPFLSVSQKWNVVNAFYYTALVEEKDGFVVRRNQMDWLKHHGFTVKTKPAKQYKRPDGTMRVKGNMDIEMVVGMIKAADSRNIQRIVLLSGDGDFSSFVEYLQETKGIPVTVISTSPMISRDLKSMCNQYSDIASIREHLEVRHQPVVEVKRSHSIINLMRANRGV